MEKKSAAEQLADLLLEGDGITKWDGNLDMFGAEKFEKKPPVSTVDFKLLQNVAKYPMFKHDQPKIGAFAQASPENMAKMLIFVVASIKVAWPVLDAYFEPMWASLVKDGHVDYDERSRPVWSSITIGKAASINRIWAWRQAIFGQVMKAVEADKNAGDTGLLVYKKLLQMPNLGLPKAGFATQLLIGKYGCIDSVNLNLLATQRPTHLMNAAGNAFHTVGAKLPKGKNELLKGLSKQEGDLARLLLGDFRGKDTGVLRDYGAYLKQLEGEGLGTEGLWNLWCGVIAHKIEHYGGKDIEIKMPNQSEPARLRSYNAVPAHLVQRSKGKIQPFDTQGSASVISGDHRRMITGESLANTLLEVAPTAPTDPAQATPVQQPGANQPMTWGALASYLKSANVKALAQKTISFGVKAGLGFLPGVIGQLAGIAADAAPMIFQNDRQADPKLAAINLDDSYNVLQKEILAAFIRYVTPVIAKYAADPAQANKPIPQNWMNNAMHTWINSQYGVEVRKLSAKTPPMQPRLQTTR